MIFLGPKLKYHGIVTRGFTNLRHHPSRPQGSLSLPRQVWFSSAPFDRWHFHSSLRFVLVQPRFGASIGYNQSGLIKVPNKEQTKQQTKRESHLIMGYLPYLRIQELQIRHPTHRPIPIPDLDQCRRLRKPITNPPEQIKAPHQERVHTSKPVCAAQSTARQESHPSQSLRRETVTRLPSSHSR